MNITTTRISGETYFFRDHGQFDLLRLQLLPELIELRSSVKTLRLWSAGCASGEEAYSLAMLVDILLPNREGWNIVIQGSDINADALEKAQRGYYRQWSFRMVSPQLQQRYFQSKGNEWILDERIRQMVSFRRLDLINEPFTAHELQAMDLILCRNVFIYFNAETVSAVANKLTANLNVGGYLMTAHTELIGQRLQNMQSRLFAEGVAYQREKETAAEISTSVCRVPAIELPQSVPNTATSDPPHMESDLTAAWKHADRGEYTLAEQFCRKTLIKTPLAAEPYLLLAQLAQLSGDFEQAKQLLEKTLYLDADCLPAYLELAALCERAENLSRAQTLRRAALEILRKLPADTVIKPYETTAAQMTQWLAQ
jgi:chemotaxis protein methyltransferase CheR